MTELVKSYLELLSFSVLAAFLLAYLLTPVCIRLGFLLGMVDQPDERRVHKTPTPRSGGIGLFLAFAGTLYLISSQLTFPQLGAGAATWISQVLPVCTLVLVLGIADDRWEISPWVKLLGQIVIGILAWMQGLHLGQLLGMTFHPVLDATCTTFLFVAAMNAYNLIDGMDGIAGGLGCITAFGLCGLQVLQGNEGMAAVCVALAGACLGFLRYNFHPARIFLGDTGSMLIGFVLMAVTMAANNRSAALVMLVVPLLTMGIPMIDTALAIWRRSVRRAINPSSTGVSTADKDHLHHRLARRGFTQRKVAVLLYAMQALVFLIGLSWLFLRDYRTAIFSIAFLVGSYVLLRYLASLEMSDSGQWIVDGIRKPGGMQLYNSLMPFMDGMILSLALVAFSWLLSPNYPALQLNRLLRESAAPIIGCPLILIWLTRYYRPHWTRARALDYFYILVITSSGVLIGFALSPLSFKHDLRETLTFVILLMALTTPAMTFLRAFPRLVQDLVHYHERNRNSSHEEHGRIRTLVYGAGYGYTLMVRAESFSKPEERRTYQLLGLIDDDPYLRGRLIHGHTVLGGIEDLPTLVEQKEVDELILSTTLEPERLDKVMQIAEEKNLRVRESVFRNNTLREPGQ